MKKVFLEATHVSNIPSLSFTVSSLSDYLIKELLSEVQERQRHQTSIMIADIVLFHLSLQVTISASYAIADSPLKVFTK